MAKLIWDDPNERPYYSGVDHGVFYPIGGSGVVWNGLISIDERFEYSESNTYADNLKTYTSHRPEPFSGSIKAYTYPDEFEPYSDFQGLTLKSQESKRFNLSFRTFENETEELIHLVYNALAKPMNLSYSTDKEQISDFGWDISTIPSKTDRAAPSSHFIIRPSELGDEARQLLFDTIYGTDTTAPILPHIQDLIRLLEELVMLRIIDHGDGTWTAIGPDEAIQMLTNDMFEIDWPSVIFLSDDLYEISDL